jgi:hypothetical protein
VSPLRWIALQRYGLALAVAGAAGLTAAAAAPWSGWARLVAGALGVAAAGMAVPILARWPRKRRALALAARRIAQRRFRPESVRAYCGDPCFRLVADRILADAGLPRAERARRIAGWRAELAREGRAAFVVDHTRGVVVTIVDGVRTEQPLAHASGSIAIR